MGAPIREVFGWKAAGLMYPVIFILIGFVLYQMNQKLDEVNDKLSSLRAHTNNRISELEAMIDDIG